MSKNVRRLYEQFQPNHYILELHPNKERMTFHGSVIISGHKLGRPSQRLTFHQNGLTITRAHVLRHDKKGDQEIPIDRINVHNSFEEVRLHSTRTMMPGQYTVSLEFRGKITRAMNGIYPCFFKHKGREEKLIATQFESHHAREVFPCIDEPEAKATFDLTLTTPAGETVIANTPVAEQKTVGNEQVTTFETTPHMSTYLLAFAFGTMKYKEATTKQGVMIRAYATPEHINFTEFALEFAVKCLEFYNDYFAIDYPLPKCDLVALPDFASGAMENWGCVTFREQALLVDPANTSLASKQYVAMVVAHELAHQWFGNLVTMRWWTDLWLNEGFASWIEYLAVDHIFPEWQMWTQFIADEQQQALKLDALQHTHPIEVPVHHPDEIRTIFDTISYSKGASVIHMLYHYLGAHNFREGLRYYLKKHAYQNTGTIDLWAALEEASEKAVKEFMHAWTSLSGFPLISVAADNHTIQLEQQRFYVNPVSKHASHTTWPVALLSEHEELPDIMTASELDIPVSEVDGIKLNHGQSGFYRVSYNASHRHRLGELIKRGHFEPLDRLGILADSFEAAKAGYSDAAEALALMDAYRNEDNTAVWEVMAGGIGSVRAVMDDDAIREAMKPYVRTLVAKQYKRLGWDAKPKESHFDTLLRPTILGMAAAADQPDVLKICFEKFAALKKPEDVHPDVRGVVYVTAARHGDAKTFDKLLDLHDTTTLSEERTTIAAALTSFKQPELIERALQLIDTDTVRLQDVAYWVAYSFGNRYAKHQTWQWMVNHWAWLQQNLGNDLGFYRFPIYTARAFSDAGFLPEFKRFFESVLTPAFERTVNQGIEMIEWQAAWKARDFKIVKAFFKA